MRKRHIGRIWHTMFADPRILSVGECEHVRVSSGRVLAEHVGMSLAKVLGVAGTIRRKTGGSSDSFYWLPRQPVAVIDQGGSSSDPLSFGLGGKDRGSEIGGLR